MASNLIPDEPTGKTSKCYETATGSAAGSLSTFRHSIGKCLYSSLNIRLDRQAAPHRHLPKSRSVGDGFLANVVTVSSHSVASDEQARIRIDDGEHTSCTTADRRKVPAHKDLPMGHHDRTNTAIGVGIPGRQQPGGLVHCGEPATWLSSDRGKQSTDVQTLPVVKEGGDGIVSRKIPT